MKICIGCGQQFLEDTNLICFRSMFGHPVYVCNPCLIARAEGMK